MQKTVFALVGPTSTGKTTLALELCKKFNGEVISADSRQVYKTLDIGTGKVPAGSGTTEGAAVSVEKRDEHWLLDNVPVWGYDLVSPDKYFSAYDYAQWALTKTDSLLEQGKTILLVGGTGFYIDLFTARRKPAGVKPDFNLRKTLEKMTLPQLQKKLTSLNLDAYNKLDQQNPARLIRAIEIELGKTTATPLPYLKNVDYKFLGLTAPREILYEKADSWLEHVWQNGLLPETQAAIAVGYEDSRPLQSLVYKSAVAFLKNQLSENEAITQAKNSLHAYIRRQQTWFKQNQSIDWFDITTPNFAQNIADRVESK